MIQPLKYNFIIYCSLNYKNAYYYTEKMISYLLLISYNQLNLNINIELKLKGNDV